MSAIVGSFLLLAPLAMSATAPAQDAPATPGPWDGPWDTTLAPAEADRFVQLWAPRILDNAWFNAYVAAEGYPEEILAEGFHSLEVRDQMYLVHALFEHFQATLPPFAAELAALDAVARAARLDDMRTLMTMFVFQKESWQEALAELQLPDPDVPTLPPMQDDGALDAALAPLRDPAPIDAPLATLPPELEQPEAVVVAAAELLARQRVRPGLLWDGAAPAPAPALDAGAATGEPVPFSPPALAASDPVEEPTALLALAREVVDASTYRVCGASAGVETCSADVPLGTPVPIDADGDAVPDATGRLGMGVDPAFPLGATMEFEVRSLHVLDAPYLGQVTAIFEVPTAAKRVVVGVDGRTTGLAPVSVLRFTLKDLAAALADDLQARVSVTHDALPAPDTIVFAVKDLEATALLGVVPGLGEGAESNPLAAAFRFDPVPPSFVLDAAFRRVANEDQLGFQVRTTPTRMDAAIVQVTTATDSRQTFLATVDELPSEVDVRFTQPSGAVGAGKATYVASAPIGLFSFTNVKTPDGSAPGRFTMLQAEVRDVPTAVAFELSAPFLVDYVADGQVGEALVVLSTHDGGLARSLYGVAQGIPQTFSLAAATEGATTFTYEASSALDSLEAGLYDRARDELRAVATVTGVPARMQARVVGERIEFEALQPVGVIDLKVSQESLVPHAYAQDHATIRQQDGLLAASLRLSGLQAFTADPAQGGQYDVTLQPGGQRFTAYADLDGGRSAYLDVSGLPQHVALDLRPGSSAFSYDAAGGIDEVSAWTRDETTGLLASVTLQALPGSVDLAWSTGSEATVTYAADAPLGAVTAFVRTATGGPTLSASVLDLPPWMQVVAGNDRVLFDARASAGAAPASADVGRVAASYGSDGAFLTGTPADDHAALQQAAAITRASLRYDGLQRLSVSTAGDELHAALQNSAPRVFRVAADTPTALLTATIDAVPASIRVDHVGKLTQYRASSAIERIVVDFDKRDGQFVSFDVRGVPASVDLDLDPAQNRVLWTASAPLTSIAVAANLVQGGRAWDFLLDVATVPSQFEVVFSPTTSRFRGISGPLGSVSATLTNHGAVTTFAGNHASAVYRAATGDLDASFRMSSIHLAEYVKTASGFTADLRMGGGGAFHVNGDLQLGTTKALGQLTISSLPTSIQVSQASDVFSYAANSNFDLTAYTAVGNNGALVNAPEPPLRRGLAVRDGFGCASAGFFMVCGSGVKAQLYLQGFPTGFTADAKSRTYSVTNFRPPADALFCFPWGGCFTVDRNSLTLDVDLDNVVSSPVRVLAVQDGIPSPQSMTFGPITSGTLGNGDKRTSLLYSATGAMGPFTADVRVGTSVGRLEISNVPSSVNVAVVSGKSTSTVTSTLSQGVSRIYAAAKASVTDASFAGGVELRDVPTSVSLSFGRVTYTPSTSESYSMPGLSYSASASTLDVTAFVDAALFGGDLTARATLGVVNLGASTTMGWSNGELVLASTPATGSLEAHVWGQYKVIKHFSGCTPSCGSTLRLNYGHHAGVVPLTINDLKVKATSFSLVKVKPGITSSITGTYGGFEFGWNNINAKLDIEIDVDAVADFGWLGCICVNVITYNNHNTITVNVKFHLATNHMSTNAPLLHVSSPIPCSWTTAYDLHVEVKPHPHYSQYNGFAVSSATAEGGGWLVTPNPWGILPDKAVWVIAGLTSPMGGGFSLSTPCH